MFRIADGKQITWIGLMYENALQHYQLQLLPADLYHGTSGIALFLATLARVTGESEWYGIARETLQPLSEYAKKDAELFSKDVQIGAASGLGAYIYTLCRVGQWLQSPELLN